MKQILYIAGFCLLSMLPTSCQETEKSFFEKNKKLISLGQLLLLLQTENSSGYCDNVQVPELSSADWTSAVPAGYTSIKGRILTLSGSPVNGALVYAVRDTPEYYGTHSSIDASGYFLIAGIPQGNYKISVEPLYSLYYGRIDTHIDCYTSPANFTAGWYKGTGQTLASLYASGQTITISSTTVHDAGTFYLNQ